VAQFPSNRGRVIFPFYSKRHGQITPERGMDFLSCEIKGVEDFVILGYPKMPAGVHLLGIDSPGLTSCLAIAARVVEAVRW